MSASKIQWSALPFALWGHIFLYLEHYNYKLVPFAPSLHSFFSPKVWSQGKLARCNYHKSMWNRAPCIGDYSPLHPSLFPSIVFHSLLPCLWTTFNLQSKQLWQGLWSFDERQRLGESEFGVMKQQCQGMIYEWLSFLHSAFTEI